MSRAPSPVRCCDWSVHRRWCCIVLVQFQMMVVADPAQYIQRRHEAPQMWEGRRITYLLLRALEQIRYSVQRVKALQTETLKP
ncbi:hypothetical protein B0H12DRAFT_1093220 [Mycena haematopus]|nr:hypothetical protein B0H12DRAFT_1106780 [Mycena haematopus]KAJ7270642.1 hypothetical protein B0H12DRAFT_1093220 [Mycena haematopus]